MEFLELFVYILLGIADVIFMVKIPKVVDWIMEKTTPRPEGKSEPGHFRRMTDSVYHITKEDARWQREQ